MKPRLPSPIVAALLAATLALPAAGGANAAVMVIGSGLAADCYDMVERKSVLIGETIDTCSLALEQEQMSRRNRAATHVNRGIAHMRDAQHDRALADFDRALTLQPGLKEAHVNRGAALINLKRLDEALIAINTGIDCENVDARATAHYNRAMIRERQGDIRGAYADFRKALEIVPGFEAAQKQLARFEVKPAASAD